MTNTSIMWLSLSKALRITRMDAKKAGDAVAALICNGMVEALNGRHRKLKDVFAG